MRRTQTIILVILTLVVLIVILYVLSSVQQSFFHLLGTIFQIKYIIYSALGLIIGLIIGFYAGINLHSAQTKKITKEKPQMSNLNKYSPIFIYLICGSLIYLLYPAESETYSKLVFNSYLVLYSAWYVASFFTSNKDFRDYFYVLAAVTISLIVIFIVPVETTSPLQVAGLAFSIIYGASTGTLTSAACRR